MEEADQLSDRIGIIDKGKIIALDTPSALKATINQKDVVKMEVAGWKPELTDRLTGISTVEDVVTRYIGTDSVWEVSFQTASSRVVLPGLVERINTNGTRLVNLNVVQPSLEDVFIHLTGKGLRD
jgi:ABC-2 type transport system ATP-binding protein